MISKQWLINSGLNDNFQLFFMIVRGFLQIPAIYHPCRFLVGNLKVYYVTMHSWCWITGPKYIWIPKCKFEHIKTLNTGWYKIQDARYKMVLLPLHVYHYTHIRQHSHIDMHLNCKYHMITHESMIKYDISEQRLLWSSILVNTVYIDLVNSKSLIETSLGNFQPSQIIFHLMYWSLAFNLFASFRMTNNLTVDITGLGWLISS